MQTVHNNYYKSFEFNQIPMLSHGADPIYQQYPWADLFVDQK